MKVLFDIGHPGHVHYFRHSIKLLNQDGVETIITARNKDVTERLLKDYQIPFFSRGKGKKSKIGKLVYMMWADIILLRLSIIHKPAIFVSFSSPYAAQVAWLLGKAHIALNDTEHTDETHSKFTYPFSSIILTPSCYSNDLGSKHKKFDGIMEAFYLSNKVFSPDWEMLKITSFDNDKPFVVLRFVSWDAHHDYGQKGIDLKTKRDLIKTLEEKGYVVIISAEDKLEHEFEKFRMNISPINIHHLLYFATLFIGESATMASESAFLGTKAVYVNSLPLMGYLKLEKDFGLLDHFHNSDGLVSHVNQLLGKKLDQNDLSNKAAMMKKTFPDLNEFLTSTIMNLRD